LKQNAISVNKEKVSNPEHQLNSGDLIASRFIVLQRGKKSYFLLKLV